MCFRLHIRTPIVCRLPSSPLPTEFVAILPRGLLVLARCGEDVRRIRAVLGDCFYWQSTQPGALPPAVC